MDGIDKIIIFTGIIKLEFAKNKNKEDNFEVPQWVKQEDIMYTRIFTDSPPLSACS